MLAVHRRSVKNASKVKGPAEQGRCQRWRAVTARNRLPTVKQIIAAALALSLFVGSASAKDCTLSNEFQINRSQVLAGVLEDPIPLPLPRFKLELLAGRNIQGTAVTSNNGEYSFGEVPAGHYRIRLRRSGDPFCAPKVECNEAGCSIRRQVKLNPKNIPVTVY
jgi:hypothetical protein